MPERRPRGTQSTEGPITPRKATPVVHVCTSVAAQAQRRRVDSRPDGRELEGPGRIPPDTRTGF